MICQGSVQGEIMKRIFTCVVVSTGLLVVSLIAGVCVNKLGEIYAEGDLAMNENTDWSEPDKDNLNYYGIGEFKMNLPVLYINTNGSEIYKDKKIWSQLALSMPSDLDDGRSVMSKPDAEAAIMINYRGASSYAMFDKKQYRIKFFDKVGSSNEKYVELAGMSAGSEWVLNGPFLDRTLVRNHLVYDLGREIFEWAPDCRYAELFVNGEYKGVYLIVEPVTNGDNRLNLTKFGFSDGQTAYIVKRDRVDSETGALNVYGYYAGKTSNSLYIDYPSMYSITDKQREWITKDISDFEEVLYGDNFADTKKGYAAYVDVDNFVDYYIFNEVVMNEDAGNLSTYTYKDLGGRLKMAIWDYNNCFDNYQWFAQDYEKFIVKENGWFARLTKDRAFVDRVVKRYEELRQSTLKEEYMYTKIDGYRAMLGDALERNYSVWGYTFYNKLLSCTNELHKDPADYDEAVRLLKSSVHKRLCFLDNHIRDMYKDCIN